MTTVLGIALAVFAAALLTYHIKTRRIMDALNRMLDEAIRGEFEAANYNETELSKIESKLSRFLSESKLKKGQIESEQEKIHSLISDISHQTKTPIANVLLYAQLLDEQDGMPSDAKALTAQITAGTEKLNFLIQSLIKTSRLESGISGSDRCEPGFRKNRLSHWESCKASGKETKTGTRIQMGRCGYRPIWIIETIMMGIQSPHRPNRIYSDKSSHVQETVGSKIYPGGKKGNPRKSRYQPHYVAGAPASAAIWAKH